MRKYLLLRVQMSSNEQETGLPTLIELPVYRDTYLSQERTDELCRLLWSERPDLIVALVSVEKIGAQDRTKFAKTNTLVSEFLRDEEKAGRVEPISLTGMVDLLYEINRRVRKILGLNDIPVYGKPIAPGPEGPFPLLIHKPILNINGKPHEGMTQEIADRLAQKIYDIMVREHPEALYAYIEMWRRCLRSGEPSWEISNVARNVTKNERVLWVYIAKDFESRITEMCRDKVPGNEEKNA